MLKTKSLHIFFLLVMLMLWSGRALPQVIGLDNDANLKSFFAKLSALEKGDSTVVNIVHIGDSHLQADLLTAIMRSSFQQDFGNAGRGLVFPYHIAGTNGPSDYVSYGTGAWVGRRAIMAAPDIPIGIMGFGLQTSTYSPTITIDFRDQLSRSVTLFAENNTGKLNAHLLLNDSLYLKRSKGLWPGVSRFAAPADFSRLQIKFNDDGSTTSPTNFYGAYLTNEHKGVIYSTIGVNGIDFLHYNQNQLFFKQLSYLQPDLIIISLGTNDAFARDFSADDFNAQLSTFISLLRVYNPYVNILITSPGDHILYRRGSNPRVPLAVDVLKQYAVNNNCAFYDFYKAMGGKGSMYVWLKKGWGQWDGIHFTKAGYEHEAQMLYDAIKVSYNNNKMP